MRRRAAIEHLGEPAGRRQGFEGLREHPGRPHHHAQRLADLRQGRRRHRASRPPLHERLGVRRQVHRVRAADADPEGRRTRRPALHARRRHHRHLLEGARGGAGEEPRARERPRATTSRSRRTRSTCASRARSSSGRSRGAARGRTRTRRSRTSPPTRSTSQMPGPDAADHARRRTRDAPRATRTPTKISSKKLDLPAGRHDHRALRLARRDRHRVAAEREGDLREGHAELRRRSRTTRWRATARPGPTSRT